MPQDQKGQPPVDFSIDGEPFTTTDRKQLARDILALPDPPIDPAQYDLGELHGQSPQPKQYGDDDEVTIHPGARFVSLRTGPAPVE